MLLADLRDWIDRTLRSWATSQRLGGMPTYNLEEPPAGIDADVACNLALLLAKPLKKSPRALAQEIQKILESHPSELVENISIAGAGFLNFRWTKDTLQRELRSILSKPGEY